MAQENGNQYVTSEHLLYALLDQDGGLIGSLFGKMGVDCDGLLSEIDTPSASFRASPAAAARSSLARGRQDPESRRKDRRKAARRISLRRASDARHLLPRARRTCASCSQTTASREAASPTSSSKVKTSPVTSDNPEDSYDALKKYGTDLVERARTKELDPVIGRDAEIRNVIRILSRKTKNNPVLIGEPGVGKTAIAEGLAQRIVRGDVPERSQGPHDLLARHGRADRGREIPRRV